MRRKVWLHPVTDPAALLGIQTTAHALTAPTGLTINRGRFGDSAAVRGARPAMTGTTTILMPTKTEALSLVRRLQTERTAWRYQDDDIPESEIPALYIREASATYGAHLATEVTFTWEEA